MRHLSSIWTALGDADTPTTRRQRAAIAVFLLGLFLLASLR